MNASPEHDASGLTGCQSSSQYPSQIWAVLCALLVLAAVVISRPYAEVGISDDFSYIWSAKVLSQTGRIVYNGGATAILGWQLYWAAAFIKIFGFSFTTTRASIIFLSVYTTYLCQRTFVCAGINEWNASIGTLTLMLSPLLMPLEVTFMSDIPGMFAIVLCLYSCLRAIKADRDLVATGWIGLASMSNVILGSSRQIAWLGVIVMVPSALCVLWPNRRVRVTGICFWITSVALIAAIMHWFQQQPYVLYEPLIRGPLRPHVLKQILLELVRAGFEMILLLLPILLLYLPALRQQRHRWFLSLTAVAFAFYGLRLWRIHDLESWYPPYLNGVRPFASPALLRPFLTIAVICSSISLGMAVLDRFQESPALRDRPSKQSDRQMALLLVPFTLAYVGLLLPRAGFESIWDRYLLPLIFVCLIFVLRLYQQKFQTRLPVMALVLTIGLAAYSTAFLHDRMAEYRARVAAVNEVLAAGIPVTSVSGGWDYDGWTELQLTGHIIDPRMRVPSDVILPTPTHYGLVHCPWFYCDMFPHVVPLFTISLTPDSTVEHEFTPVPYRTWISPPGTIYVVHFPDISVSGHVP